MADIVYPGETPGGTLGSEYLPANYDLVLYKGDYFSLSIVVKDSSTNPLNLTGYTSKCQIRTDFDAPGEFEAVCTIAQPTNGTVHILFPSAVTTVIPAGTYAWDFQLTEPNGNTRTYLAGDVLVYGEITK